ncbi:MAG: alanine--tRNA ligase [Bacteroidetes bacterium]|nr:MAG: alanine--tRNA ligase [Bacteroidota bacterium]
MNSLEIRNTFLDFFKNKQHEIVPSAPIVVKDDPTLMFINAGMNQFKDLFLGNTPVRFPRIADTQKCLRVSGKHNDLDEVGHDTYHHTMFEMLGNWSFGDYFKKEAIDWAWELFTEVYQIDKSSLYATVFEGDKADGLEPDMEAYELWKKHLPESQILFGSKKDNFWEMGDTGPSGPCSEIHVDIRTDEEKKKISGRDLVNQDHPEVIELWNLVFIEFNRLSNGTLQPLADKHVDTGMGFERLAMVLQGVRSNYDTDIFVPIIQAIAKMAGTTYNKDLEKDIAMRVIADHLRAVAFTIADGQLPSNTGAGYVIRRILRRAVRYGFTFLNFEEPFLYRLLPVLIEQMGNAFPELKAQQELIGQVLKEEEVAFLRTLSQGIKRFEQHIQKLKTTDGENMVIDGQFAFELFDTFGFPIDLTQLMAREEGFAVDMDGFNKGLEAQKNRSRKAATVDAGDWIEVSSGDGETAFVGYNQLEAEAKLLKYRKVVSKKKTVFEVVLDQTPFYAESGGQLGDKGILENHLETLHVIDTKKENNQIVHFVIEEPKHYHENYTAKIDALNRKLITNNHSATHLMHAALRKVLGTHVEQKGSMVSAERFRFDFSHFSKMSGDEIRQVEKMVNEKVRENLYCDVQEDVKIEDATGMGAMALFGEKYGDSVRVVSFDPDYSIELCGGTHVNATGEIGFFKIVSESGIAAGVRRIEAVTAQKAEDFVDDRLDILASIKEQFKNQQDVFLAVNSLIESERKLQKEVEILQKEKAMQASAELFNNAETIGDIRFIKAKVETDVAQAKNLAHKLRGMSEDVFVVLALTSGDKVNLVVALSDDLVSKGMDAGKIIREISRPIKGGGGGQPQLATAGGKDASGIEEAFEMAGKLVL